MKKLSRLTLACILVVAMLTGMIAFSAEFFLSPDTNWTSRVDGVSKFNSFALAIADNQFANSGGIVVMGYIGTVGTTPPTYMGADAQLMNSNGIMYGHSGDTYCDNGNITSGDFISFYATPPTAPPPGTYYGRADTWTYFGGEQDRQMTFNTASTKCVPGIVFSREDSSESAALFSASETVPSWDDTIRVNESGQTYGTLPIDPNGEIPELVAAMGIDGTEGYIYYSEAIGHAPFTSVEQIEAHKNKMDALRKEANAKGAKYVRVIPLYASDGKTVIGEFGSEPVGGVLNFDKDGYPIDALGNPVDIDPEYLAVIKEVREKYLGRFTQTSPRPSSDVR